LKVSNKTILGNLPHVLAKGRGLSSAVTVSPCALLDSVSVKVNFRPYA
jgi:hypothetical protein